MSRALHDYTAVDDLVRVLHEMLAANVEAPYGVYEKQQLDADNRVRDDYERVRVGIWLGRV